jgi:hypothetical protein
VISIADSVCGILLWNFADGVCGILLMVHITSPCAELCIQYSKLSCTLYVVCIAVMATPVNMFTLIGISHPGRETSVHHVYTDWYFTSREGN